MGIKIENMEAEVTTGVVGDGTQKTILHQFNREPQAVLFTPDTATAQPFLVSKSKNDVVVQGATDTFYRNHHSLGGQTNGLTSEN